MNYIWVHVMEDIFNKFKKEGGSFKAGLCEDAMGLLSMNAAVPLGVKGEAILEEAQELFGLPEKFGFFRDRLLENYLLAIGVVVEPQYSRCRIEMTKAIVLMTAMADIYDVHGLPDELKVFTDTINRWDLEGIDQLPEYMKLHYLELYNTTNETAYIILKEKDSMLHII
ncbi:terpene synthase 4 [Cinnamomum micranthum f. kanehirae]|uniref:Terpene synthase 4 n=1 Tax=Cinnamomum micranthum f. kanehirae TaxID=337451 RepID=A0A443NFJ7_9MAGN|nr:terpene synthase 4 [Cinnamomum micranthum f. kanehirae]